MGVIGDADLQAFSDLATDLALKDMAEILRNDAIRDTSGGFTPGSWPVALTSPCAVIYSGLQIQEQNAGQQTTNKIAEKIYFPRGTDIRATDRIRVNGNTYHVIDIPTSSYEVLREAQVTQEKMGAQ